MTVLIFHVAFAWVSFAVWAEQLNLRVAGIRTAVAPPRRNAAVAWLASNSLSITRQVLAADLCDACQTLKDERLTTAKAKQRRTNWTLIKRLVGVWLAISVLKVAVMICPQCVINKASAVVCGHRSALHHAGVMMAASNTILNVAVVCSMHQSQLVTLLE